MPQDGDTQVIREGRHLLFKTAGHVVSKHAVPGTKARATLPLPAASRLWPQTGIALVSPGAHRPGRSHLQCGKGPPPSSHGTETEGSREASTPDFHPRPRGTEPQFARLRGRSTRLGGLLGAWRPPGLCDQGAKKSLRASNAHTAPGMHVATNHHRPLWQSIPPGEPGGFWPP